MINIQFQLVDIFNVKVALRLLDFKQLAAHTIKYNNQLYKVLSQHWLGKWEIGKQLNDIET